jgi:hypothetical protein
MLSRMGVVGEMAAAFFLAHDIANVIKGLVR